MSSVAEQIIETATMRRDRLLARAEAVDDALMKCIGALETARCELVAAHAAAELSPRQTVHIRDVIAECEAEYERHRRRKDELLIAQGTAWAELEACDGFSVRGMRAQ
jgi:hypothetical protein